MKKQEILTKLNELFFDVLEHHDFNLTNETTANDVDGWDSITHMMIITKIEETLNIKFKLIDLMNMNNIGDLLSCIEKELKC